jgi:hypothetical protein
MGIAMPSWLSGAARTLDISGRFDVYAFDDPSEADASALLSDLEAVGSDLRQAMSSPPTWAEP